MHAEAQLRDAHPRPGTSLAPPAAITSTLPHAHFREHSLSRAGQPTVRRPGGWAVRRGCPLARQRLPALRRAAA
eukprot:365844-Chlamydomonas_euryale.AAC.10